MHEGAYRYVAEQACKLGPFVAVLEVGSRDINGSVRGLFDRHDTAYEGVDIVDGPGVDYVCDATAGLPPGPYDAALALEVFEHLEGWPLIVGNAAGVLMPGGVLLLTMAGPGRGPHSACDGGPLRDGEWYENVDPDCLVGVLEAAGLTVVDVDTTNLGDVYATATKDAS